MGERLGGCWSRNGELASGLISSTWPVPGLISNRWSSCAAQKRREPWPVMGPIAISLALALIPICTQRGGYLVCESQHVLILSMLGEESSSQLTCLPAHCSFADATGGSSCSTLEMIPRRVAIPDHSLCKLQKLGPVHAPHTLMFICSVASSQVCILILTVLMGHCFVVSLTKHFQTHHQS